MAADSAPTAGSDRSVPSTSADLFDPNEPVPADPSVRHGPERARLSAQCAAMLAAFRADPYHEQTTAQLAAMACKYTSRISDLRRAGHRISIHYRNRTTGDNVYLYQGYGAPAVAAGNGLARRCCAQLGALLRSLRATAPGNPSIIASAMVNQLLAAGVTYAECRALAVSLAAGRPS